MGIAKRIGEADLMNIPGAGATDAIFVEPEPRSLNIMPFAAALNAEFLFGGQVLKTSGLGCCFGGSAEACSRQNKQTATADKKFN